ncbi:MAG: hypothetical protein Q7J42_14765 [Sulfuritalea sp.]|nr:hypothetical protein [Sulfuritalea sp.]
MDLSTRLQLTLKGADELKHRTCKLGMKKRSMLILLDKPQSVQYLLGKSVFTQGEVIEEIRALVTEQFIAVSVNGALHAAGAEPTAAAPEPNGHLHLHGGIVISEAKFLLIDFCVDHFGTGSQAFVDEISACGKENDLGYCLGKVMAAAQKRCPDQLPKLLGLVKEINETA